MARYIGPKSRIARKFKEAIYILHAFAKKTQKTSATDLALATRRYRDLLNMRRDDV